ncbi:MAG TPA: AlpA family phage regulatory protein [Thiobacillus sp.]|nr:AlpA family phage regulatory protein [Thiobacillus sp.]
MHTTQLKHNTQTRAIRLPRVCEITASSKATTWRRVQSDPTFPKPFRLSPGVTVWDEAEIIFWLESKKALRDAS